jgi:hypothetical protein
MRLRHIVTAACAVALIGAAAAPASAVIKTETARFRVTAVSGQQSSSWTLNNTTSCGTVSGSGKQTFNYHLKKPVTLEFMHYLNHNGMPWVHATNSSRGIPVTGSATREGKVASTTSNPNCRGTPIQGPAEAPPQPDCGTKHYDGFFDIRWYRPQDYPAAPDEPVPLDTAFYLDEEMPQIPFFHCPFSGPLIMQRLTHAPLPEKKVFGTQKKIVLKASAHRVDQNSRVATGVRADTTVSWKMVLLRLH